MQAKGGDIDLYIETTLEDSSVVWNRKGAFWLDLRERIGEQKIDIVINQRNAKSVG